MGLELSLAIYPWILTSETKYLINGMRSVLDFIESFDTLFDNIHHLINLDLDFDAPVGFF